MINIKIAPKASTENKAYGEYTPIVETFIATTSDSTNATREAITENVSITALFLEIRQTMVEIIITAKIIINSIVLIF